MRDPDKPQQIIDAAIRVFARNGYYNSRVSDIAREAGIASGTIYLYFKTKDEILVTLFRDKMAEWVASVRREVAAERDPLAKVRKIVALHFRVLEDNPELTEVLQVELRQGQKFFRGASAHEVSSYFGVINDVLEEAARVRHDLGYPIIVSPFAQFVMTQAVLNVMGKERYATVPDEVRKYVLGYYGEIAGPIDPNLYDRITRGAEPTKARPGDLIEPGIPRVRRNRGPFASDDDLLLAAFYSEGNYQSLKAAGPIKTNYPLASTPLVTLLKEIALRPDIRAFHVVKQPAVA